MKVYLDDERKMPDYYDTQAFTEKEAVSFLKAGLVREISLDHDLGEGNGTGYSVISFIEKMAHLNKWKMVPDIITIHTANPVGRVRMVMALKKIEEMRRNRVLKPD
jgi:hypothetical protein